MLILPLQSAPVSAREALRDAVMALQRAHIDTASLDARLLLEHALGISREQLLGDNGLRLDAKQDAFYRDLIAKRAGRQPVAQLTGKREFWGMIFKVTAATLDPRPDTETLIEAVLERCKKATRILDLGTGTGCLLLALLKEYKNAKGLGVDISEDALAVARENSAALGFSDRAEFTRSDWANQLTGTFDIIISNPPYIPTHDISALAPEVAEHEPKLALNGGEEGLDAYRAIVPQLPKLLARDGLAALEIGMGQELEVEKIIVENSLKIAGVKSDLGGIPRTILIQQR